jgi:5-methylcytosine-specific restriction endonuclease McrA
MKMNKKRQAIYDKSGGKCWYCGCELVKGWHADHVEPIIRDFDIVRDNSDSQFTHKTVNNGKSLNPHLDKLDNLVPSCAPCNLFKSTFSIEGFRMEISYQVERARKSSVNFRTAERFGQISIESKPIVFWFELNVEAHDNAS